MLVVRRVSAKGGVRADDAALAWSAAARLSLSDRLLYCVDMVLVGGWLWGWGWLRVWECEGVECDGAWRVEMDGVDGPEYP